MNGDVKGEVLKKVAGVAPLTSHSRAIWKVGNQKIHVRFRSDAKRDGHTFAFNINPNTLRADRELWICGSADRYYLVPISEMRFIYDHPDAYEDKQHPEIRVADIDTLSHRCLYGRGQSSLDFANYFGARLI